MEAEVKAKSDNYIQLKENEDILKLRIRDEEGNDTGEMLVFNLEDLTLPDRSLEMQKLDKRNRAMLRNEFAIIDKKQDKKGKLVFSAKEEAKIKAMQEFYKKEVEVYDLFLGKDGVKKLLNGRELSWSTLDEIDEIIDKVIIPKLEISADNIKKKIIKKYSNKKSDVIE